MSEGRNLDPLDRLAASPTAVQIPPEEQDAVLEAGGDPLAVDGEGRDRPQVHVPATDLALMFRLCAIIGSEARLAGIMAPNAITLLEMGEDARGASLGDVRLMLATTLLPEDPELVPPDRVGDPKRPPDLCVVEMGADDRSKTRVTQEATQALVRGFEAPHPVLILAEDRTAVPDDIRRALPEPLRLAPLSRAIVMAMIAASCSATGKIDPCLYDALPSDHDLARLPEASLVFALRASTPRPAHLGRNAGVGPLQSGYALPASPHPRVLILIDAGFSPCLSRGTDRTWVKKTA